MKLDIRIPLGLLFVILGLLIALFGLAGPKDLYARSLGINVNLGGDWCCCCSEFLCFSSAAAGSRVQKTRAQPDANDSRSSNCQPAVVSRRCQPGQIY